MKTPEELNTLKNEIEVLSKKLSELNEDELAEVTGGDWMRPSGGIPIVHSSSITEIPGINGAPSLKPTELGPTYFVNK